MQSIQLPSQPPSAPHPILNLGFRIFFAGAAVFAILTMLMWYALLNGQVDYQLTAVTPFYWHGHEMLYGYACAVIAGFLLTAVKTWTSQPMPYGYSLLAVFMPWLLARVLWLLAPISSNLWLAVAAVMDLSFWLLTCYAVIRAVWRARQQRQIGIIAKLALLLFGQTLFYVGIWLGNFKLQHIGLYLGLYLIIGVVFTIGRRVMPFFIERGVSEEVKVKNAKWLDVGSLLSFFAFMLVDIFYPQPVLVSISAAAVAGINLLRLWGWHTPGIWQKPLLWSLYLSFLGMCVGFVMFAVQPWLGFAHSLAVHGVSVAGIALMTLAMMSRVALGHTGRNIHQPPRTVGVIFILMIAAYGCRVLLPLLLPASYALLLSMSQGLWVISFVLFCIPYLPILARPRTDGLFG